MLTSSCAKFAKTATDHETEPSRCGNLRIMPPKKKSTAGRRRATKRSERAPVWTLGLPDERGGSNGTRYEHQMIKNPYVPGEREKMLEKREALTLRAFQIAYENHHPPKGS